MRLIFYTQFLWLVLLSYGQARQYSAAINESVWRLEGDVFICHFRQPIVNFGFATFEHQAGEDLIFYLESQSKLLSGNEVQLSIEAPSWRPSADVQLLNSTALAFDDHKFAKVAPSIARAFMAALSKGLAPTISSRAAFEGGAIRVQVSPVNFKQYYAEYLACQAALLPVNFSQIQRSGLLFASGRQSLSAQTKKQLDHLILYVKADSRVNGIFIEGHTDADGTRYSNRRLSERRTQKVYNYLIKAGLDAKLITSNYHGERYPVASNTTINGKQRNRRVTVRVEREE